MSLEKRERVFVLISIYVSSLVLFLICFGLGLKTYNNKTAFFSGKELICDSPSEKSTLFISNKDYVFEDRFFNGSFVNKTKTINSLNCTIKE